MSTNENSAVLQENGTRFLSRSRFSILAGIVLSLLIHALAFWFLFYQMEQPEKLSSPPDEGRLTIRLAPAPSSRQSVQQARPDGAAEKPAEPSLAPKRVRKPQSEKKQAPVSIARTLPGLPRETPTQENLPEDDMFSQLEAKRKRRAEARAQAGLPEQIPSSPAERANNDNSIALANIATSMRQAKRENQTDSGGVFQLRSIGYRNAQVFFRGWSTSARRDRTRLIDIEQGSETDIQTAVVKKMMEIIREERQGDFIWESHRLGRQLTLSARQKDSAELQQFLMEEFFPAHSPGNRLR